MNPSADSDAPAPSSWAIILAFAAVYLAWGSAFLATKVDVRVVPPALFGGLRLFAAGVILFAYQIARGHPLRMSRTDFAWAALAAVFMFLGGNFLITTGQRTVDSGVASVLVATTPCWMALLESLWPWGERLTLCGWLGLAIGLGGVVVLLAPQFSQPETLVQEIGPFLILGSALAWSIGSFVLRYRRPAGSNLLIASTQMTLGGGALVAIGLASGELGQIDPAALTWRPLFCWVYLLVFGSLLGFVAYTWLLAHVPVSLVGTYAYVNPVIAILIGVLIGGERLTVWTVGGMVVILGGVALVRAGRKRAHVPEEPLPEPAPRRTATAMPAKAVFQSCKVG